MTSSEVIERWERWWFPHSTAYSLAVCRILIVGSQLFIFMPFFMASPSEHLELIERGLGFDHPQWMIRLVDAILPDAVSWPDLVRGAYLVTIAAGLTTLVGFRTRVSASLFALGTWFVISHEVSYGEAYHTEIVISFFLLFLALSPSGLRLSIDALLARRLAREVETSDQAVWPLRLIQALLAWGYFSNAIAKLAYSGLDWMNGYTLRQYLLTASLQWNRPLGFWLAQHHALSTALSIGTMVFELSFPLALFARRFRLLILVSGVIFHLVIYFTMRVVFLQHIVLFAVFIDFEGLANRLRGAPFAPVLARS